MFQPSSSTSDAAKPAQTPVRKAPPDPPHPLDLLFVGTHGHVAAIHRFTGREVWRTSLASTGYSLVTLLVEEGLLFAASKGLVFALNPATGEIYWKNELPGLGHGFLCLATLRQSSEAGGNPVASAAATAEAARHAAT